MHRVPAGRAVVQTAGRAAFAPAPRPRLAELQVAAGAAMLPARRGRPVDQAPAARPSWPRRRGAGPGHSVPTPFSLGQHQPDAHLLQRLRQPRDLRPRRDQLRIDTAGLHPGPRRRERLQRALLGDLCAASSPSSDRRRRGRRPRGSCSPRAPAASQISYFSDGDRNRLRRRPPALAARPCSVIPEASSSKSQSAGRMRSDQNPGSVALSQTQTTINPAADARRPSAHAGASHAPQTVGLDRRRRPPGGRRHRARDLRHQPQLGPRRRRRPGRLPTDTDRSGTGHRQRRRHGRAGGI